MKLLCLTCLQLCCLFFSLVPQGALADEVILDNGDRISGSLVKADGKHLTIKTAYAGEVKINWQSIATVTAAEPVEVLLSSGKLAKVKQITNTGQQAANGKHAPVSKADIAYITPPSYLSGKGAAWRGRLDVGASSSSGNTHNDRVNASGEVTARTLQNRFKLSGRMAWAAEQEQETEANLRGTLKAEHFLDEKWFAFARTAFHKDRFQDLNLRSIVGAGSGYQFVESAQDNFYIELGVDYIHEDNRQADDDEYPALRWALNYDSYLYRDKVQFFHEHGLNYSIEGSDKLLFESETGLRFSIHSNLHSTLAMEYDWNNRPAAGKTEDDSRYIFTLGYKW